MTDEIENASFLDEKVALSKGAAINPWADTSLLFRREPLPVPAGERRISVFKRPDMAGYLTRRAAGVWRASSRWPLVAFPPLRLRN
jgi:hypothetical protein